jgi:hypothetical protein
MIGQQSTIQKAFERLSGTRITTDIRTNGVRQREGFGIIDSWKIVETNSADGRMVAIELRLSDWLYYAIVGLEVLDNKPRLLSPFTRARAAAV